MTYFNEQNFENIKKNSDSIPDGVIDATEFYEDLVFISNQLENTDYEDMDSKMRVMMNIINYYHNPTPDNSIDINTEKLYGVTIGLLFHIANMLVGLDEDSKLEYWDYINKELLPTMKEEKTILPYWNNDD